MASTRTSSSLGTASLLLCLVLLSNLRTTDALPFSLDFSGFEAALRSSRLGEWWEFFKDNLDKAPDAMEKLQDIYNNVVDECHEGNIPGCVVMNCINQNTYSEGRLNAIIKCLHRYRF